MLTRFWVHGSGFTVGEIGIKGSEFRIGKTMKSVEQLNSEP
jgi:hypothetical protein